MNSEVKTSLQEREFSTLRNAHRVILRWATGVGKSKMTIDLVNKAVAGKACPKVAFIVAEKAHIKNWEDEFDKWGLNIPHSSLIMLCYASLHKLRDKHFDILILDEAHHCFTEKRRSILETISSDYIYLLSATLSWQKISAIEEIYGKFTISTVTLKDAINSDILPDPKVNIIEMELDNTVADQEIKVGSGTSYVDVQYVDRAKYIYRNIPCIIHCTAKQKYDYYTQTMEYWKQRYERSHNDFHRNKWVNLGSQRKRFLGENKTAYVKKLIDLLQDNKRYICFCASVAQCNTLGSVTAINSKRRDNQQVIDDFNDGKTNTLFAVGMATEGMNLTNIQVGIIVQLDGNERLFIQKFGRSLRAEDPVTYIFYYKNTQDENYLKKAIENIDEKFLKHININQLSTIKQ